MGKKEGIIRHRTLYNFFITILAAAVLLCGCAGSSESGGQDTASVTSAAIAPSEAATSLSASSDALLTPSEPSSRIRGKVTDSLQDQTLSDASDIYDLSSLSVTGRASLLCYGMYDEERVLLVYLSGSGQIYRAVLLDLAKKNLTQIAAWKNAASQKEDYNYVKLLSCQPLVVFDSVGNIIYRPDTDVGKTVSCSDSDSVFSGGISENSDGHPYAIDETNVSVQCMDGSVYLSDPDGFLKRLTPPSLTRSLSPSRGGSDDSQTEKDTSSNETEDVYTLPWTYTYFTPVHMNDENRLTFLTYPQTDDSQAVFVSVDPKAGTDSFYTCDTQTFYDTEDDGYLFSTYYDGDPALTICDPSGKRQLKITLPQSISSKLEIKPDSQGNYPSDGGDVPILAVCSLPIEGELCLFSLDDSYGSGVSSLYLADLSQAGWESFSPPGKKNYTLTTTDYGDLTDKTNELAAKYGLQIEIGSNVPTSFDDYDAAQVTDTSRISFALSTIGDALSIYPQGYFSDVSDGYYRDIVIYLTGTLTPHDNSSNIKDAGGFTTQSGGLAKVAFNIDYDLERGTIIHELTHVLDYRLEGRNEIDDTGWNELNPEGFDYYYSYIDSNGNSYEYTGDRTYTALEETDPERIFFVDTYSKTYPMEDRARLMEYLLQDPDHTEHYFGGNPIQKKLAWYFQVIRKAIGKEDWPQKTAWEEALEKAAKQSH